MSVELGTRGMGATIAAALLHEEGLAVVNVGDSPVLELVGERLVQLTTDDVAAGGGLVGIRSSTITQSLGGGLTLRQIAPHNYEDQVAEPRRLLLCTDGLTTFVPRERIAEALSNEDLELAVRALLELALDAGGSDNVTCVLVETS